MLLYRQYLIMQENQLMSKDKKILTIDLPGGGKAWVDQETWEIEKRFFAAQEELVERTFWYTLYGQLGDEQYEKVKQEIYEKHGVPYHAPDPFKLDFYFIITDKGLMAKDRKTGNVYVLKDGYEPEVEPYTGEYKYIRDARGMDL